MPENFIKQILSQLAKMDKLALCFQIVLLTIGVIFIYGAGVETGGDLANKWRQQLQWIFLGFILYLACAVIDYRKLGNVSWILYCISLVLLGLVFINGAEINNARSWVKLGAIRFQPSEIAKPATIFFLCWAINHKIWRKSPIPSWLLILLIIIPPIILVLLQPDFGTALAFLPFSLAIAFIKGLKWRWIICGILGVLILSPIIYNVLKPHQKNRMKVFLESPVNGTLGAIKPFISQEKMKQLKEQQKNFFAEQVIKDKDGKIKKIRPLNNWNALQSILAVGSGGMLGKGYLNGTQHVLGYLPKPVAPTDFIFSIIAEETGFFGSAILIALFLGLILCCFRTAFYAVDQFGACLALGIGMIFTTHVFINIGMTIQILPIIGIPLPFVSYGGSFVLSTMIMAGLCQSIHIHHDECEGNTL